MTKLTNAVGRLAEFAVVLVGVTVASFLFLQWLPGDPAELYAGEGATDAEIAALRQRMGLDAPVWAQVAGYAHRLAHGDLGDSLRSGRPVSEEIRARLPATLSLACIALLISGSIAIGLGIVTSVAPRSVWSRVSDWTSLSILAIPVYWLGILFILIFAVTLGWAPPSGDESLRHLLLPGTALGLHTGAATARVLSASLADALDRAYTQTARGKGLGERRVLLFHALPNALIPVVTYFATEAGRLFGGAVLTETVFAVNGIGRYLIQSIQFRDYPAVVGVVFFIAIAVTTTNAAADLLCRFLDPRTRSGG